MGRPELLNRVDEIIVFSPLAPDDLHRIAGLLLDSTSRRAKEERNIILEAGEQLVERIVDDVAGGIGDGNFARGVTTPDVNNGDEVKDVMVKQKKRRTEDLLEPDAISS